MPLAKQALAFIDRGAADDPATAGEASELAFLLAALLEAGDENFRLQALRLLFRLGVEGEVLAVIHLEKLPEDQALVILGNLSDEEKLLFANAFFRRPRFHRPRTGAFGLETLSDVVEKNPDELLILLDLLANRHEYPALPLRNALVRGRLGMWLRRLLQMDLSAEQTRYMTRSGKDASGSAAKARNNRAASSAKASASPMIQPLEPFKQHIDPGPAERNPQTRTNAGPTGDTDGQQGKREHVDERRKRGQYRPQERRQIPVGEQMTSNQRLDQGRAVLAKTGII